MRLASLAFALTALLALSAAARGATGFVADETLSSRAAAAFDVAMAPNGYAIVGWAEGPSRAQVVRVSVRPPGGDWSAPETFPVGLDSSFTVSVAIASSGAAAVAWEEVASPSTFDVGVATRAARGPFTGAEVIRGARQILDPSVGVAADGTVTLLYTNNPNAVLRDFPAGSPALAATEQPLAANCSLGFGTGIAEAPSGDAVAPLYCSGASFALRTGGSWTVSPTIANDIQRCPSTSTFHTAVMATIDSAGHPVGVLETDARQPDFSCMGGGFGSDTFTEQLVLPLGGVMTPVSTPAATGSSFGIFAPFPISGPQAAIAPTGIVFSWGASDISFRGQVNVRFFAPDASGGTAAQPVGPQVTGSPFPRLALAANGRGLLAWVRSDGTDLTTDVAVREPGANAFGSPSPLVSGRDLGTPLLAMDDAGDGLAAWTQGSAPAAALHVRGFDATPPQLSGVTIPASGTVGRAAAFAAASSDMWGPVTTSWSFGDGGAATGAAVQHAYAREGSFTATVTATDAVGNVASRSGTVQVTAGGATGAPRLTGASLTNRTFRVGRAPTAVSARRGRARARRRRAAPVGTTFRFTLDRAANVRIGFARQTRGVRNRDGDCVRPSRRLRGRRRCKLFVPDGTLVRSAPQGAISVPFSGRVGRRALRPGSYRAGLTAAIGGRSSKPVVLSFRVVR